MGKTRKSMRHRLSILAALLLTAAVGCSFSDSSKSSSDSSSSPFRWSSSSSGGGDSGYRNDISESTYAYVQTGGALPAFQRELGRVAERHGVTDWEGDPATWFAMGEGLARAGVNAGALEAFKNELADGDANRLRAIQIGYETYRSQIDG